MDDNLDSLLDDLEELSIHTIKEELETTSLMYPEHFKYFREELKLFRTEDNKRIIKVVGKVDTTYFDSFYHFAIHLSNGISIKIEKVKISSEIPNITISVYNKEGEFDRKVSNKELNYNLEMSIIENWKYEQDGLLQSIKAPLVYLIGLRMIKEFKIDSEEKTGEDYI